MTAILVIDDNEEVCRAVVSLLEPDGYVVHTAQRVEDGIQALDDAQKAGKPYAVALVDMRFDNYAGSECERAIAGKQVMDAALRVPFIEVIVVTAYGDTNGDVDLMEAGAFAYLRKGRGDAGMREMKLQVARAVKYRALRKRADLDYRNP